MRDAARARTPDPGPLPRHAGCQRRLGPSASGAGPPRTAPSPRATGPDAVPPTGTARASGEPPDREDAGMQDTELFIALAEIAGIFVGFGALIAIRSAGDVDVSEVTAIGWVVWIGIFAMIAALAPVTLGRFGIDGHELWFACSVLALALWWGVNELLDRASVVHPEHRPGPLATRVDRPVHLAPGERRLRRHPARGASGSGAGPLLRRDGALPGHGRGDPPHGRAPAGDHCEGGRAGHRRRGGPAGPVASARPAATARPPRPPPPAAGPWPRTEQRMRPDR